MSDTVLVTGGAGYVGSHTVAVLRAAGVPVVVVDNLTTGHRGALARFPDVACIVADLRDESRLRTLLRAHRVGAVVHFAAASLVPESMERPLQYYANNVAGTTALVSAMVAEGVDRLVFSSTAAVYGNASITPIPENAPTQPTNPYGETKLAIERLLHWAHVAHGLRSVALRYFNAAGADPDRGLGEDHRPETHLIPRILAATLRGEPVAIYGTDYPTPDGTAVRDYVHVLDLAEAHRLALEWLADHPGAHVFNLGSGTGQSVRAVVEAVRRVTGRPVAAEPAPRRPGDPPVLVAAIDQARATLNWNPVRSRLDDIIASAWAWVQQHPNGYAGS